MASNNCQYSTRYCWDADKVKALIRLRAELSPLFTGKRNASKYAWAVVERELNVPLPLSKIIKKWNNLLQEYKAIKISEEPKRREWPFFSLMDVYFSDQVNDPSLRLFSSTKTLKESLDESVYEDDPIIASAIAAATSGACMEIDELLKRQKERRSNENKLNSEKRIESNSALYSLVGNKPNVINVKNSNFLQNQQENIKGNNLQYIPDQEIVKNEKTTRPTDEQQTPPSSPAIQNKYSDPNTIDQYLLSWNNFLGNMSRGFHTLQKDEKMVDVTIAAGGKIFKAHKLVLSVCSPYFQEIFLENPSNHPILLMADVEANHMAGLLNFMYSGQILRWFFESSSSSEESSSTSEHVNVKYEDLPVFLKVAEAMKIKGLHTEKPEGQNLKEIQFSHSDSFSDLQVLGSSYTSLPLDVVEQTTPTLLKKTGHPTNSVNNLDSFRNNNNLNFEHGSNKFSILKANASRKLFEHTKQQKYSSKRKIFVHCESDLKEKRIDDVSENIPYNKIPNVLHPENTALRGDSTFNNDEVLNLTQNTSAISSKNSLPRNKGDLQNSCQYNQTSFTKLRMDSHSSNDHMESERPLYTPLSCEDSNNNICNDKTTQKNNASNRDETFQKMDSNKITETNYKTSKNDNNNNNCTENNSLDTTYKSNNDCNDTRESKKGNLSNFADNNNNVFIVSNSTNNNLKESNSINEESNIKIHTSPY